MSDDQVKSYIDRVQRLQEEKRTIEDDIKEVYAEARGNGYDVKVLRAVVKHLGKDQDEVAEFDAVFDLYLQAYEQAGRIVASRTHVAGDAGARTREERSKDRLSEAMADNKEFSAEIAAAGLISDEAHAENVALSDAVAANLGSGVISEQPSGAGTGSAVRAGSPVSKIADPDIQPSVQSEAEAGASPEQGSAARADREGADIASAHVDQFVTLSGEGEGGPAPVDPSPAADAKPFKLPQPKPLRPNCLKPEQCGGYGSKHCGACERAGKSRDDDEEATDAPAFVSKTHEHAAGDRA